jgi:hypothetical protein
MDLKQLATMSAYIKEQLQPLAEKLGQTAQFTYGIFIKQVWVNAITTALWIPVGIFMLWLGIYSINYGRIHKDDSALLALILIPLGIMAVLLPLVGIIQALINPDYAAIQLIFNTIKSVQ